MDGSRQNRAIWDLALIYAMSDPQWASFKKVKTSKEYGGRDVTYISSIDAEQMYQAFFDRLSSHLAK
jgi:hypothetical protein